MKKRLLIFISVYLPGVKAGGPIRSIEGLVYHLKDKFDIYIYTSDRDLGDTEPYIDIDLDKWIDCRDYKVYYSHKNKSFNKIAHIINAINPYKIYLNGFFSYNYSIKIILMSKLNYINSKIVLACRGEFSPGALNINKTKKKLYIWLSKVFGLYSGVDWHASTDIEKKDIINVFPNSIVKVALNLSKPILDVQKSKIKQSDKTDLVYVSRISPKKNLKFALEVLSNIRNRIKYDIYGPIEDVEYWEDCLNIIKTLPSNIEVNYIGIIKNDDVVKVFSNYDFLFFPTLGENFGHVIRESLSAGTPVIISDQTPWKDLVAKKIGFEINGFDIKKYINVIEEVACCTPEDYNEMSLSSQKYIEELINNPKNKVLNELVFE